MLSSEAYQCTPSPLPSGVCRLSVDSMSVSQGETQHADLTGLAQYWSHPCTIFESHLLSKLQLHLKPTHTRETQIHLQREPGCWTCAAHGPKDSFSNSTALWGQDSPRRVQYVIFLELPFMWQSHFHYRDIQTLAQPTYRSYHEQVLLCLCNSWCWWVGFPCRWHEIQGNVCKELPDYNHIFSRKMCLYFWIKNWP